MIFATGPIRVFLKIRGGETSIEEITADLQDKMSHDNKKYGNPKTPKPQVCIDLNELIGK